MIVTCVVCRKETKRITYNQKYCSDCRKDVRKEYFRNYQRDYRWRKQLEIFGLTIEDYNKMLKKQNYVCKICGKPETHIRNGRIRRLAVDHDHKTGEIRGLLCSHCNKGLGEFYDNPLSLIKAARYLK